MMNHVEHIDLSGVGEMETAFQGYIRRTSPKIDLGLIRRIEKLFGQTTGV